MYVCMYVYICDMQKYSKQSEGHRLKEEETKNGMPKPGNPAPKPPTLKP